MEQLKRATTPFRFLIPEDIIPVLRGLRARQQPWRDLIEAEDVVHLYYGLGPAMFLTFDGRVLVDRWDWDDRGAYEVTDPKEAWVAVVLGADDFDVPDLLRLLPPRRPDAIDCPVCGGAGWVFATTQDGREAGIVCWERCGGLGWVAPRPAG